MDRTELQTYIEETYGVTGECLWTKHPTYMVFRHNSNQKWFAAIMEIPREKLGLFGDDKIAVVDVKCDTRLIGSFLVEMGLALPCTVGGRYAVRSGADGEYGCDRGSLHHVRDDCSYLRGTCTHGKRIAKNL